MIKRRDLQLLFLCLVLGPPIWTVSMAIPGVIFGKHGRENVLEDFWGFLPFAYGFGWPSTILMAVFMAILSRMIADSRSMLALSPAVGAFSIYLGLGVPLAGVTLGLSEKGVLPVILTFLGGGALVSLCCYALLERFGSPLPPRSTMKVTP